MKTITLEISDDFLDKFSHVLEAFPLGKVKIKHNPIAEEIERRILAIESGEEVLTPYKEGMDEMIGRLKQTYANS